MSTAAMGSVLDWAVADRCAVLRNRARVFLFQLVRSGLTLGAASLAMVSSAQASPSAHALRSWTPSDSVAFTYISVDPSIPLWSPAGLAADQQFLPSPDGHFLLFTRWHGDEANDAVVGELLVYSLDAIQKALAAPARLRRVPLAPLRSVTFRSAVHATTNPPMTPFFFDVQWDEDSSGVRWQNEDEPGRSQIYRLDLSSGVLEKLQQTDTALKGFVLRGAGSVYKTRRKKDERPRVYPFERLRLQPEVGEQVCDIYARYVAQSAWQLPFNNCFDKFFLSPDGSRAIVRPYFGVQEKGSASQLVDLREHTVVPLTFLPAPLFRTSLAGGLDSSFWSSDSVHVVLAAILPSQPSEAVIADYGTDSGTWTVLEPLSELDGRVVTGVGWLKEGRQLLISRSTREGEPSPGRLYVLQDGHWVGQDVPASVKVLPLAKPALAGGIKVTVRQSANDPPVVVASDGKNEIPLTAPDPILQHVWWARQEPFPWKDSDGKARTSGLTLPRDFRKGQPVPLVIQQYHYFPQYFLPDGDSVGSCDATQALAAQGFAVVQMESEGPTDLMGTSEEGPHFVKQVDRLVDALVAAGIVDPARIGLTGFSRSGYHVYYTITHPGRTHFAAAVGSDNFKAQFDMYLSLGAQLPPEDDPNAAGTGDVNLRVLSTMYGLYGGSFWDHKAIWLRQEPTFNLDRVRTPILFTVNEVSAETKESERRNFGAFVLSHRPVDYLFFPQGVHQLQRPRERIAIMEVVVDWMNFWLRGKQNPDPSKAEQNHYWRALKVAWEKTLAAETTRQALIEQIEAAGIRGADRDPATLNNLGYEALYGEKPDTARAIRDFQWNLGLFPNDPHLPDLYDSLAEAYLQAGDREHALQYYDQEMQINPLLEFQSAISAKVRDKLKAFPDALPQLQQQLCERYLRQRKRAAAPSAVH